MRLLKKLSAVAISLAALAILGLYGLTHYANSDAAMQLLVQTVQKQTGRELKINGGISPALSLHPTLSVRDVSLSNPKWAKKDNLLQAEELKIGIALLPLLRGETVIHSISLQNASLALEQSKGRASWEFDTKTEPKEAAEVAEESIAQQAEDENGLNIEALHLSNTAIYYRDGSNIHNITVADASAEGLDLSAATVESVMLEGSVEKAGVSLSAHLSEPGLLQFDATAGNGSSHQVKAEGSLALGDLTFDAALNINTSSLKAMAALAGLEINDPSAIQMTASAGGTPEVIKLSKISGNYGPYTLNGDLTINTGSPMQISGKLHSPKLVFAGNDSDTATPPAADETTAPAENSADAGDDSAELPALPKDITADIALSVGSLQSGSLLINDLSGALNLKDGVLKLNPLNAKTAGGTITGNVSYNGAQLPPALTVSLNTDDVVLAELLKASGNDTIDGGVVSAYVRLKGKGHTVNQYLASTTGAISFLAKDTIYKDPPEIAKAASFFELLQPQEGNDLKIECALADFTIKDGVADSKVIAAKAPGAFVSGDGEINLAKQTMYLTFQARSNLIGFADVAPPLKVKGPLSSPELSVDKSSTLVNIGKWALGTVTGVGLVAMAGEQFFDKTGITRDDPCVQSLAEEQEKAEEANANPQETYKNAEDAVSDKRDQLKEQFDTKEKEIRNLRDNLKGLFKKD